MVPRLHVLVGPTPAEPAVELAKQVLDAGAPLIQVRVKADVDDRRRADLTWPIVELCHEFGALAVVNDRADVCVAVGADGVHGGASDLQTTVLRDVVGPDRLVGATARGEDDAADAAAAGADYVGLGPVYLTASKSGLPEPGGTALVSGVTAAVAIPVIAIAGVTVDRVGELLDAGAHGVAVHAAVTRSDDPAGATEAFLRALGER